jgi:hypothetical protein
LTDLQYPPMRYLYLIPFLALFALNSCSNEQLSAEITDTTTRTAKKELARSFMKVTMNNLRVRATPDLEGAVLQRLKEESIVEYMLDSTNFTTMVEMKGEEHHDHWYKVKTDAGNEGWVYGGCVSFLEKKENSRILALKVDAEKRAKANGGTDGLNTIEVVQKAPEVNEFLLKRYQAYINAISLSDPNAMSRALAYYESIFPKSIDGTADEGFADLMTFYEKLYNHWKPNIKLSDYQYMAEDIKRYGSPNMQTDVVCRNLDKNALHFGLNSKNKVVLKPNVDFLMRRLYRLVSDPAREYLEQYAVEQEKQAVEEGQIVVNITELAAYTVFWDKFLTKYPYFPMQKEIKERRMTYLSLLLRGSTANPAFNPKTDQLNTVFKEAYKSIDTQFGHSPLIEELQKYHQRLKNASYAQSSSVLAAQEEVINSLK